MFFYVDLCSEYGQIAEVEVVEGKGKKREPQGVRCRNSNLNAAINCGFTRRRCFLLIAGACLEMPSFVPSVLYNHIQHPGISSPRFIEL